MRSVSILYLFFSSFLIFFSSTYFLRLPSILLLSSILQAKVFYIKFAPKDFAKFSRRNLCWSLFLLKLQALAYIKERLWHRCFPVNLGNFLRMRILQNIYVRLVLYQGHWNKMSETPFKFRITRTTNRNNSCSNLFYKRHTLFNAF